MSCRVCGGQTFGPICGRCKGEPQPSSPDAEYERRKKAHRSMIEALRWLATQACGNPIDCGTVCLCAPCHARIALDYFDPEWRL